MSCVNVWISHSGSGNNAVIKFTSSSIDGRYAQGSQAWGWGGMGSPSDAEYLETKVIPNTLSYLGGKFKKVYGREMTRYDICGQGEDPAIAARDLAAKALFDLQEAERKLLADKKQIELQTQMLGSETTIWASEEAYAQSIDVVNANIDAFNPQIQGVETLREKAVTAMLPFPGGLSKPSLPSLPSKQGVTITETVKGVGISILLIPIAIVIAIIVLARGK